MFHVKLIHGSTSSSGRTVGLIGTIRCFMVGVVMVWAATAASAAVYKCTGADGKIAYRDQPCTAGQAATTVKPATVAPLPSGLGSGSPSANNSSAGIANKGGDKDSSQDPGAAAPSAARDRIRAGQTPQCVTLGDRITSHIETGARGVAPAEMKATADRYEQQCAAQAKTAIAAENARNEARQKQLMVDEECKEKRRVLAERRPRLASLSSEEKKPFHRRN